MAEIYLDAAIRETTEIKRGKVLRRQALVPAVVYGEGKKTLPLKIERGRLIRFMHAHRGGENMVITLRVSSPGQKKPDERPVIIKEIQSHPVNGEILHVDFNEVSLTKRLTVKVPIAAQGEPVGVKQEGGTLEQVIWEIEVECLPTEIPAKFEVDVSNLKIGDKIEVKNLPVPEGVVLKHDLEAIVFSVVPPHKEEIAGEAAPEAAAAGTEPEVIKKEKKVEEGEEVEGKAEPKKAEPKEKS